MSYRETNDKLLKQLYYREEFRIDDECKKIKDQIAFWLEKAISIGEAAMEPNLLTSQWVCMVVRSGYHNGACCTENDPHDAEYWGCSYYFSALVRDPRDGSSVAIVKVPAKP